MAGRCGGEGGEVRKGCIFHVDNGTYAMRNKGEGCIELFMWARALPPPPLCCVWGRWCCEGQCGR